MRSGRYLLPQFHSVLVCVRGRGMKLYKTHYFANNHTGSAFDSTRVNFETLEVVRNRQVSGELEEKKVLPM